MPTSEPKPVWYVSEYWAPSIAYSGGVIQLECHRAFDGFELVDSGWVVTVTAESGDVVYHSEYGEPAIEDLLGVLVNYYDGLELWTLDETGETFTFYEMLVKTLPMKLIADAIRVPTTQCRAGSNARSQLIDQPNH